MGNAERNHYVKDAITAATIRLLKEKPLSEITISEITFAAGVSRNSFYRNYTSADDILEKHVQSLLHTWNQLYEGSENRSNSALYASLFEHLEGQKDFYLLLKKRGLFYLFPECLHAAVWLQTGTKQCRSLHICFYRIRYVRLD